MKTFKRHNDFFRVLTLFFLALCLIMLPGSSELLAVDEQTFDFPPVEKEIFPEWPTQYDGFGTSVAISGDYAIVGAPYDDDLASDYDEVNGEDSGSVYVYERIENVWTQVDKLTWPYWESDLGNYFGIDVALSGDRGIVSVSADIYGTAHPGISFITRGASGWFTSGIVTPSDVDVWGCFGCSIAISGDYALAGYPGDDDMGDASGSVYVFELVVGSGWTEAAKLNASDGAADQRFGASVAVSGSYAAVGAVYPDGGVDGTGSGSVYVFERIDGSWTEVAKLAPSDGAIENRFGNAVALDGNHLIVGAWGDDEYGHNAGAVYFFERISGTWEPLGKTVASDIAAGDWFGKILSISGDQAVVQASGTVYVFEYSGGSWTQVSKVTGSGSGIDNGGYLSGSVSISGDRLISGVTGDSCSYFQCYSSGLAMIFEQNGSDWNPTKELQPYDGASIDWFGQAISISGDYAVVGARGDDNDNGKDVGAAYIFKRSAGTWMQTDKLIPLGIESGDGFGSSVALDGDTAIAGSPYKVFREHSPRQVGVAYVFRRNGGTWIQEYQLNIPSGLSAENFGSSIGVSGDYAVVGAPDSPPDSRAYVFERLGDIWTFAAYLNGEGVGTGGDTDEIEHYRSVAISGDYIITGTPSDDENGTGSGAAHIYERVDGSWTHVIKLNASDGAAGDDFSRSVAISGNYAIVGAWKNDGNGIDAGAAYIFERVDGVWTEVSKLNAPDGTDGDWFGRTVDIKGDVAVVGATSDIDVDSGHGSVYVFVRRDGSWVYAAKLRASDGVVFGRFVALADNPLNLLVGHYDSANGPLSGSVYSYLWDQDGDDIGDSWDADMDGDGMPNEYELEKGFDPRDSADGGQDVDIDGFDSASEYMAATDPNDNSEHPGTLAYIPEKLFVNDGAAGDEFGISVSISGDRAIVGAYHDTDRYNLDSGSAYLFEKDAKGIWEQVVKLNASDGETGDEFGISVSIDGDRAIVGARGDDDLGLSSGSAYVFEKIGESWLEVAKLSASDGTAGDNFGTSVAIAGEFVVIGADGDDDNGVDSGSAYVFEPSGIDGTWMQRTKIRDNLEGAAGDHFGSTVAIWGDIAIVGAPFDDNANGIEAGSSSVFRRAGPIGWFPVAKLTASDGDDGDHFGESVAISDGHIIVGASFDDENGSDSGSAYVFNETWTEVAKLTAPDGATNDRFGASLALDRDYAIIGAGFDDDYCSNSGSAYVYERTGANWVYVLKLSTMDCFAEDHFGFAVSISGNQAIVASPADDDAGSSSGAVYMYSWDRDQDGLSDFREAALGTDPNDADSDDDGLADGVEDANQNGVVDATESNPLTADTDSDGLLDGTEAGVAVPVADPDGDGPLLGTDTYVFIADADPSTLTDPLDTDSDDDLIPDGVEDPNLNGMVDSGEGDPGRHHGEVKILPTIPGDGDRFGVSVSISGGYAIAGAFLNDEIADNAGAAYVFENSDGTWIQAARLTASDGLAGDYFGYKVAIDGNYAIVGADDHDINGEEDAGAAYVFERVEGTWTETAKLSASDGTAFNRFGGAVDIGTDIAAVGANSDDDNGPGSGSVYVFERIGGTWTEAAKLTASDGAAGDRFGNAIAIENTVLMVAAIYDDDNGEASGSVYVFERIGGTWTETAKLIASDGAVDDFFGGNVAMYSNVAMVSASGVDASGIDSGAIYVFERIGGTWIETAKLAVSDGWTGGSVAIYDDRAVVGGSESAYVFLRTASEWHQVATLTASDGAAGDKFGSSVAIDGQYALVGAYWADANGLSESGAAYSFSLDQDGDRLFDYTEDAIGTDPYDADSDTDSMPDGWEVEYNLNPLTNDALLDYDSDRYCNLREYLSISDPWNDQDIPPTIADFDFDEDVDGIELTTFSSEFGIDNCSPIDPSVQCEFDFNGDGEVNYVDLQIISEDYGRIGLSE